MSWHENAKGECNNPACRQEIYWNPQVRHPTTGRPRPLNSPYLPDSNPTPDLHLCMNEKRPGSYINKFEKRDHTNNVPAYVKQHYHSLIDNGKCLIENCFCIIINNMKDPLLLEASNKKRAEWLNKWENLET